MPQGIQKLKLYSLIEINSNGVFSALLESDESQIGASKTRYHYLWRKIVSYSDKSYPLVCRHWDQRKVS